MAGWVYMMASGRNGTIYTGVTSDLQRRVMEHRQGDVGGFTAKYGCKTLVWYEFHDDIETAIQREKSIKRYKRQWKLDLIEGLNPDWQDMLARHGERLNAYRPTFQKQFHG